MGNLNDVMINDQSTVVSNALNNALNHVSDNNQFQQQQRQQQQAQSQSQQPSQQHHASLTTTSPIIQPRGNNNKPVQIIPLLAVSQLHLNQKDPINLEEIVDENKILPMMEH